jgi:hypothetical protein
LPCSFSQYVASISLPSKDNTTAVNSNALPAKEQQGKLVLLGEITQKVVVTPDFLIGQERTAKANPTGASSIIRPSPLDSQEIVMNTSEEFQASSSAIFEGFDDYDDD